MHKNTNTLSLLVWSVAFAIALLIPVALGLGSVTWTHVNTILCISVLSILLGRQLAYKLNISELPGFAVAFQIVIGFSALSLLVLIFIRFFKISSIQAFVLAGVLIGTLSIINIKSLLIVRSESLQLNLKSHMFDAGVLIFISLVTTLWCRELISSLPEARATGVFHVWPDIFLHSSEIVSLQNYSELSNQSLYLAGTKQRFYHLASYAISAFYASINNESALNVSTYFWTPVGIILMGISVYGLGCVLAGRLAGIFATAAIFLVPDASMYGLKIGFFGFHWLLQISAGTGYAMALIIVALAVYVRGVQEGKFSLILLTLPMVIFSAFFRVQIAAPAAIMFTLLALIVWKPAQQWHRWGLYFLLLIAVIVNIILFESIELAPHFLSGEYTASKFFDAVHSKVTMSSYGKSTYGSMYKYLIDHSPLLLNWVIGYGVFLIAALGLIFPCMFFWNFKKLRSDNDWQINIIPGTLLLSCFIIIVFLPVPADGDFSNFGHRQFVLLYAICLTILTTWLTAAIRHFYIKYKINHNIAYAVMFALFLAGIFVPWEYGKGIQQPRGWATHLTENSIPSGLFKSTSYIREHSLAQDWMLSSNLDPLAVVVSLTERPAYLSRGALFNNLKGESGQIYATRKLEFGRLQTLKSIAELNAFASKHNIKWLLKYPNDLSNWPESLLNCNAYESGGYRVYNLQSSECQK
jgi:hypothetical protein